MAKCDLSKANKFEVIPEGTYKAVMDFVDVRKGRDSGEEYLNWKFKIVEGDYVGRTLFLATSMQQQASWKLKNLLLVFGMKEEEVERVWDTADANDMQRLKSLKGQGIKLIVEHVTPKGSDKIREKVVDFLPYIDGSNDAPPF